MKLATTSLNSMMDALGALPDAGGTGSIQIRTGAAPTNTTDANTGTLLATLGLSADSFGASTGGSITAAAISSDTNVDNSGTAGHFRIFSGAGTCIAQGSVGTSATDLIFNTVTFVAGGTCAISSLILTLSAGS
jgi:hypothetical protein